MRRFNSKGLDLFRAFVEDPDADESGLEAITALLHDPEFTEAVAGCPALPSDAPQTRFAMAREVAAALAGRNIPDCLGDEGMMAWLSVHYHRVTFFQPDGKFFVGSPTRHIFKGAYKAERGADRGYNLRHRHLVRTPLQVFHERGDLAEAMLSNHPSRPTRYEENLVSRKGQEFAFMRSNEFMRLFNALFTTRGRSGRWTMKKAARDAFERLIVVGAQLDATYDLGSMRHEDMLGLLPAEFDAWKAA